MPNLRDQSGWHAADVCECLPHGFITLDQTWNFTYVNANAARLMGRSREELMGRCVWQVFPLAQGTQFQEQYEKAVEERRPVDFEAFFDPHHAWYEVHAHPAEQGLAVYFRDVSESHETLAKLRDTIGQLEGTHALLERTRDECEAAKREAENANQAKNQFLSRMSHELRTPLNAILGFGQVLEMGELGVLEAEGVGHILKGGKQLLNLINEVLDISRIEAGELSLSLEPVSVRQAVRDTIGLLRPLARSLGVTIINEVDEGAEHFVTADSQRLRQVLLNLGSNGVKYNRPGGSVAFFTHFKSGESGFQIGVRDSGYGLTSEDLSRLFVAFERLGAAKNGIEGTGMGLVLSKRLIEAMGGTIEAQSIPGHGSTFSIILPPTLDPLHAARGEDCTLDDAQESGTDSLTLTRKLLCIEDNLANLHLVEVILERRPDICVIAAMQGSTGLDLARQHQPSLILLDLHLPDINGYEVLKRLRADPATHDIPVVIISADATPGQVQRLLAAGAREYITKPIQVRHFLGIVNEILHRESG